MKKFSLVNNIIGWSTFLIAAVVYLLTIEPTTSLWDCGEFIASAYKLQVGHPPGAPLFMIMGRIFSLFAGGNRENVAMMVNTFSALSSAFTIIFLYWTIVHLAKKFIVRTDKEYTLAEAISIFGSGLVGALAYTFSDTFWFSAVEGEVYASSSFFTAIVFWIILKWENVADEKYANRWLILIALMMGLSIGVHLLNLLAIPAITMVIYFKKYKITSKGVVKTLFISFAILGSLLYILIPGIFKLASGFELLFVNGFGLPFNSGVLFYAAVLIAILVYGIYRSHKIKNVLSNTIFLCITAILMGYSVYTMIIIRSLANTPLDENNPDNVFTLISYLNREQYGDRPLIYGQYFNAKQKENDKKGKATYSKVDGKYKRTNYKTINKYEKEYVTFFPRMWSSSGEHIDEYLKWGGIKESYVYYAVRDENGIAKRDREGKIIYDRSKPKAPPSFANNIWFFLNYQVGHMYFRYFMWNFVGRQNDIQGNGEPTQGNWISGINFLDNGRIGSQKNVPSQMKNYPSRNVYYFLPFLLGLIGLLYQLNKDNKNFWVIVMLFFLTGIAIVLYVNQNPLQPRERDYAYAGSFYSFAIWIGLGIYGIIDGINKKLKNSLVAVIVVLLCLLFVPGIMAKENWDDHDRSGRYIAHDIAYDYLNSCAPNAILFTNGDNDTFPLWYIQEVEGVRTDVRVVNLMLLNMDWYIEQMTRKAYDSDPLPITMKLSQYRMGTRDVVFVLDSYKKGVDLKTIMDYVLSDNVETKISYGDQKMDNIPTINFMLPVDSAKVIANGTVKPRDAKRIEQIISWKYKEEYFNSNRMVYLNKSELAVMDILANNNWERPIYFVSVLQDGTLELDDYFQLEGFAYRLVPIKTPVVKDEYGRPDPLSVGRIDTDIMYDNLMNKFRFGRMNEADVYIDDFNARTISIVRLRNRFSSLANALINEGKTAKAKAVLNKIIELTPNNKIPYDIYMLSVIEPLYRVGEINKANSLMKEFATICCNNLNFYMSQKPKYVEANNYEIRYNMYIIQNIVGIINNYKQVELEDEIRKLCGKYLIEE